MSRQQVDQRIERGRLLERILVGLMAVTMLFVTWSLLQRVDAENQASAATETASQLATKIDEVCDSGGAAAAKLGPYCQRAEEVVRNPEVIVQEGPQGPPGPRGEEGRPPTAAEIREAVRSVFANQPDIPERKVESAVADYLSKNPPEQGESGRAPTEEEISVAVAAYCSDGSCVGPQGEDGEQGPPPSDEQIAAAVAEFCDSDGTCEPPDDELASAVAEYCSERNMCRGPAGEDGSDGKDGRGIVDVACNSDADLVITYDQPPTTQVIDGPCRLPTPTPTVDPTPTSSPTPTPSGPPTETAWLD